MKSAWTVAWDSDASPDYGLPKRPVILPYRWGKARIKDFMRCHYWNSGLFTPSETMGNIDRLDPPQSPKWDECRRLVYGFHPSLIAWLATELNLFRCGEGKMKMTWTAPPGTTWDEGSNIPVEAGVAFKGEYIWDE